MLFSYQVVNLIQWKITFNVQQKGRTNLKEGQMVTLRMSINVLQPQSVIGCKSVF